MILIAFGRAVQFLLEIGMPYATECRPRLTFGNRLDEQFPMTSV